LTNQNGFERSRIDCYLLGLDLSKRGEEPDREYEDEYDDDWEEEVEEDEEQEF